MRPAIQSRTSLLDTWSRPIDRWADRSRAGGTAESTVRTRCTCLRNLARAIQDDTGDPTQVTAEVLRRYIDARTWQPTTYRNNVKAIRAFFRHLHEQGIIPVDPARTLPVAIGAAGDQRLRDRASANPERPLTGPAPLPVPSAWASWMESYRRYMRAGGQTSPSVTTRMQQLGTLARWIDPIEPGEVTLDDLIDYMSERDDWKPEFRRSVRGSIRAFYAWAVVDGRIETSPANHLPRVKAGQSDPRPASERAYADAFTGAEERIRLMMRLSAELGLRRAEVACVHARDLTRADEGWQLLVHGKGEKDRMLPVPVGLAAAIRAELDGHVRYLFPGLDDKGHLSPRRVGELVRRQLGDTSTTMHQLRHRFATQAYATSRDLLTLQRLMGHSSVATTQRYVAIDDSTMRAVVNAVSQHGPRHLNIAG